MRENQGNLVRLKTWNFLCNTQRAVHSRNTQDRHENSSPIMFFRLSQQLYCAQSLLQTYSQYTWKGATSLLRMEGVRFSEKH